MKKMLLSVALFLAMPLLADTPILRINAGGAAVADPTGDWLADKYFVSGASYVANVPAGITVAPIDKDVRNGTFTYQIPVPNGSYRIVLRFMEVFANYQRTFNVIANGSPVLPGLNVASEAGGSFIAITKTINVTASNLQGIELKFVPLTKSAIVSAIEVYSTIVKPAEWCPSPALSRLDDTTLVIMPNASPSNPCYLNFNVVPPAALDPINTQQLTAPFTVSVPTTTPPLSGDLYVWATAPVAGSPITPTKIFVGSTVAGLATCPNNDCTFSQMSNALFPANTAPLGTISVNNGILGPRPNNIIDGNRQITVGPGAAMSLTISDGVLFAALEPMKMQQIMQANRQAQAESDRQINQNNYLSSLLKSAPLPVQKLDALEKEMAGLRQQWLAVQQSKPVSEPEAKTLRMIVENIQRNYMNQMQMAGGYNGYRPGPDMMQIMDMVRNQSMQMKMQTRVSPPTNSEASCLATQWAEDATYKYECNNNGHWFRYKVEAGWSMPQKNKVVLVPQTQIVRRAEIAKQKATTTK